MELPLPAPSDAEAVAAAWLHSQVSYKALVVHKPIEPAKAHWPTKHLLDFFGLWKKWPQMAPNRAGKIFFLLIQTLPTFWAERILILRIFIFFIFWTPNFWISRSQISGFPDFQKSGFPGSQISQIWHGSGRA